MTKKERSTSTYEIVMTDMTGNHLVRFRGKEMWLNDHGIEQRFGFKQLELELWQK